MNYHSLSVPQFHSYKFWNAFYRSQSEKLEGHCIWILDQLAKSFLAKYFLSIYGDHILTIYHLPKTIEKKKKRP